MTQYIFARGLDLGLRFTFGKTIRNFPEIRYRDKREYLGRFLWIFPANTRLKMPEDMATSLLYTSVFYDIAVSITRSRFCGSTYWYALIDMWMVELCQMLVTIRLCRSLTPAAIPDIYLLCRAHISLIRPIPPTAVNTINLSPKGDVTLLRTGPLRFNFVTSLWFFGGRAASFQKKT